MLFERRLRDGLVDGSISVAFRRWRRAQVTPGKRYRLGAGAGLVLVESVSVVAADQITPNEARAAGFESSEQLERYLRGSDEATSIYRIVFGPVTTDDPREVLRHTVDDLDALAKRLSRIDHANATLKAIAEQPGVRAADLMVPLGWTELQRFKAHVRRLKELGLTISLEVGYRLSPRGEAFLTGARPGRRSGRSSAVARDRAELSEQAQRRAQTRVH